MRTEYILPWEKCIRKQCHFFLWTLWFEGVRLVPWQLSWSSVSGSRFHPSTELRAGTWLLELLLMHYLHQDFPSRPWSLSYITSSPDHSTWHRHSRFKMPASLLSQKVKCLPTMQEDLGSIPGLGRSPGEGNGNPIQHSCLENPMDGGAS